MARYVELTDKAVLEGTIIPKGVSFMSYAAASNVNEEYWGANAAEFDLARFLQLKDGGADMKYNFVVYPVEQLVRLELRVLAVRIAQKYKFEVVDQREVGWAMNMIQSKFKVIKL